MYDNLAKTAQSLITRFGAACVLTRTTGGTYSPTTRAEAGGTTTTVNCNGVRLEYNNNEIDGEMVQKGDFKLYINTQGGAPAIDDNALFDGVTYRVMDITPLSPAGTAVYYELRLRS